MISINHCILCGSPHSSRELCQYCQQAIISQYLGCYQCAEPLTDDFIRIPEGLICGRCQNQRPAFDHTLTAGLYQAPLSNLLHNYKFHKRIELSLLLSQMLLHKIIHTSKEQMPHGLVAIPLHKTRLKQRGYNQALIIARFLSKKLKIPLLLNQVVRNKNTIEQSSLKYKQRIINLKNAFNIRGDFPPRIAIIDDIVTTGCTVNALARKLKDQGIKHIDIWAIAKTPQIK